MSLFSKAFHKVERTVKRVVPKPIRKVANAALLLTNPLKQVQATFKPSVYRDIGIKNPKVQNMLALGGKMALTIGAGVVLPGVGAKLTQAAYSVVDRARGYGAYDVPAPASEISGGSDEYRLGGYAPAGFEPSWPGYATTGFRNEFPAPYSTGGYGYGFQPDAYAWGGYGNVWGSGGGYETGQTWTPYRQSYPTWY